jgi:hypothetical protein
MELCVKIVVTELELEDRCDGVGSIGPRTGMVHRWTDLNKIRKFNYNS